MKRRSHRRRLDAARARILPNVSTRAAPEPSADAYRQTPESWRRVWEEDVSGETRVDRQRAHSEREESTR
jgi:hypothetical protein